MHKDSDLYYPEELDFGYIAEYYSLHKYHFSSISDAVINGDHWLQVRSQGFLYWFRRLVH